MIMYQYARLKKISSAGAEKLSQPLRACAALPKDRSLFPSTHTEQLTTACNSSSEESNILYGLHRQLACVCTCT